MAIQLCQIMLGDIENHSFTKMTVSSKPTVRILACKLSYMQSCVNREHSIYERFNRFATNFKVLFNFAPVKGNLAKN